MVGSPDDRAVDFDLSVFWEGDTRYIKTLDEHKVEIIDELSKPAFLDEPFEVMARYTGRDVMRKADLLLLMMLGLAGVGQMVAWEENGLTTSKLRGFHQESFRCLLISGIGYLSNRI